MPLNLITCFLALTALVARVSADDSQLHRLTPVPIQQVAIQDEFWSPKLKVWREVTIPDCLTKFEKDGALTNFDKVRDGSGGEHGGPPWYDGLIYEMIRGCADFLAAQRDPALEARLDGYIERIAAAAAKDPDGYLNTWTQLKEPAHRWGLNGGNDVEQHDVYNAGAMVEAAVHYYRATCKLPLLQVATRLANHMVDTMGPPPRKNVVPGHSLGEEALVKLYLLFREKPELKSQMGIPVEERKYLELAEFWIDNRGNHEGRSFGRFDGSYAQDHQPVVRQETIEGHAVRATLLCTGLAAAGDVTGREDYLAAARRLWKNMVERRMYIIGGLGAVAGYEGFGPDYVLPNNGYLETCAAIGAGFFHRNMNLAFADARYADELERVLYNAVLPGVSLAGNTYFYENPLEASSKRQRWAWHGCPCCPPMFLKIMGALPGYIYAQDAESVYVNLFVGSRASVTIQGVPVTLRQTTQYPWTSEVKLSVEPERETEFALCVRLPAWCAEPSLKLNGQTRTDFEAIRGYARLRRKWQPGDVLELSLPMTVQRVKAHPKVEADIGRIALQRGPLIYCVEGADNGGDLRNLVIPPGTPLRAQHLPDLLGSVTILQGSALAVHRAEWPDQLYLPSAALPGVTNVEFTAIPYFANANRQPGEMLVWMAETTLKEEAQSAPRPAVTQAQEARIEVKADHVLHPVSRYLTGACLEDVNHEVYGGIYSQMVFGESFQEPPITAIKGFKAYGGSWRTRGEELDFSGTAGDRLVSDLPLFADGEVGVEVFVGNDQLSNAGLIVRVNKPGAGVDNFDGYEIALNAKAQNVRLGRHRRNWELIRDVPCEVAVGQWVPLKIKLNGRALEIFVNGNSVLRHDDGDAALPSGTVGLRQFQAEARYRNLWIKTGGQKTRSLSFDSEWNSSFAVSGMWRPVQKGQAKGALSLETDRPFVGRQAQRLTFVAGPGEIGVENQGLNRWGMCFVGGKSYEGVIWARAEAPTDLFVTLENRDGSQRLAEKKVSVKAGDWQRLTFKLTPKATVNAGRLAITLRKPGSVALGYVFLQPGDWGRFKGLPVRRDVAEGLIDQGITVLRYGGSMINHDEYRWKKMIGPRDRRPPYSGTWYAHSSNGWGIFDFLNFCEAAGFEYVPAFNMGETPEDMADFIRYAKGPAGSEWGRRRAADGHPKPYRLRYLELGNEERVDESYWQKFKPLAESIWVQDPEIILVVGDFFYNQAIQDPYNFSGGAVNTLAAHKKILDLAREHKREVWFDIHTNTEQPPQPGNLAGELSLIDQLAKLSPGAKYQVVIFELNAGNHSQKRALANAAAINLLQRDGRIPIVTSANCLQPDGQNDNDWNQGLLFLDPSQVWLQPPGYVTQIFARNYLPNQVECEVTGSADKLDVSGQRSADGKTLALQVVNPTGQEVSAEIHLAGFQPRNPLARVVELSGPLEAANTAPHPNAIAPQSSSWKHALRNGSTRRPFPPYSITALRLE